MMPLIQKNWLFAESPNSFSEASPTSSLKKAGNGFSGTVSVTPNALRSSAFFSMRAFTVKMIMSSKKASAF